MASPVKAPTAKEIKGVIKRSLNLSLVTGRSTNAIKDIKLMMIEEKIEPIHFTVVEIFPHVSSSVI